MDHYWYADAHDPSGSATPSPAHTPYYHQMYNGMPPQRSQTAAHFHNRTSSGVPYAADSPRYNSKKQYSTQVDAGGPRVSSRKHSFSKHSHHHTPKRERRSSYSYYRTSHGDSDEDEIIEVDGVTYILPAQSRGRRYQEYYNNAAAGYGTDYHYYKQDYQPEPYHERRYYQEPIQRSATRVGHSRRASASIPVQRTQSVRPERPRPPPSHRPATLEDAIKCGVPTGYSLKHWDPTEEPIILLGSVFDSNSLGKWIYDWTVCCHSAGSPIAEYAGEVWLSLIELAGKLKRSEDAFEHVRVASKRAMLEDFIKSGELLLERLQLLLRKCEAPMMTTNGKRNKTLVKGSGEEFVKTLFTRREMGGEYDELEAFMESVRVWSIRFDANCGQILKNPGR